MVPVTSERETALAKKKNGESDTPYRHSTAGTTASRRSGPNGQRCSIHCQQMSGAIDRVPCQCHCHCHLSAQQDCGFGGAACTAVPRRPCDRQRAPAGPKQAAARARQRSAGRGRSAWANTRHVGVTCEPSAM